MNTPAQTHCSGATSSHTDILIFPFFLFPPNTQTPEALTELRQTHEHKINTKTVIHFIKPKIL